MWAQTEIRLLEERVARQEKLLDSTTGKVPYNSPGITYRGTTVSLEDYRLVPDTAVRICTDKVGFDVSMTENGGLRIYAQFRDFNRALAVIPETSNVFQIHVLPDGVKEKL